MHQIRRNELSKSHPAITLGGTLSKVKFYLGAKKLLLIFEENCFNCNYGLNKLVNRDCVTR